MAGSSRSSGLFGFRRKDRGTRRAADAVADDSAVDTTEDGALTRPRPAI